MSDVQSNQPGNTVPQTTGDISAQTPPQTDPSAATVPPENADLAALADTQSNAFLNSQPVQRSEEGEGRTDPDPSVAPEGSSDGESALSDRAALTEVHHVALLMRVHGFYEHCIALFHAGKHPQLDDFVEGERIVREHLDRV